MQKLLHKAKRHSTFLTTDIHKYEEKTAAKIASYKSIAALFNSAHEQHVAIDSATRTFEEKFEEFTKEAELYKEQLKWYDGIQPAYKQLLQEFKRRVTFEEKAEKEARIFAAALEKKFEEEVKERNKFKKEALRYFPPPLQPLLFELPIKYEIFPTQQKTAISMLHEQDSTVFDRITNETARSEMTMDQLLSKKKMDY